MRMHSGAGPVQYSTVQYSTVQYITTVISGSRHYRPAPSLGVGVGVGVKCNIKKDR